MKYSGSCLCGDVTFEIDGEFERFYLCHCQRCRKDTGSAHAANLFSSSAQLHWLSGIERVATFTLPDTAHGHSFCNRCGSALGNSLLVVPAGSLDTPLGIKPDSHLFMASRADWDDELERLPRCDGLPDR